MNFLKIKTLLDTTNKVQCSNCHKKDVVFIKIEWFLLCGSCLKEYLYKILEEKCKIDNIKDKK